MKEKWNNANLQHLIINVGSCNTCTKNATQIKTKQDKTQKQNKTKQKPKQKRFCVGPVDRPGWYPCPPWYAHRRSRQPTDADADDSSVCSLHTLCGARLASEVSDQGTISLDPISADGHDRDALMALISASLHGSITRTCFPPKP